MITGPIFFIVLVGIGIGSLLVGSVLGRPIRLLVLNLLPIGAICFGIAAGVFPKHWLLSLIVLCVIVEIAIAVVRFLRRQTGHTADGAAPPRPPPPAPPPNHPVSKPPKQTIRVRVPKDR
jgi:hypothetical protein